MDGRPRTDPRYWQLAMLGGLLAWGQLGLGFELDPASVLAVVASALALQALLGRALDAAAFDPRSALISALSICLLLRTGEAWLGAAAAALAIGSKFLIRRRGKHLFNPTAFALVALLLATDRAWVSPGQWGSVAFFAFLVAGLGGLVVNRAERSDVTWAFLASYAGLVLGRALWLGDPLAIALHQLRSGALLVFAFFMISDPRTTPDSRPGRLAFGFLVAAGACFGRFVLWEPDALFFSLVACALLVPLLDQIFPGRRYRWTRSPSHGETHDEPTTPPVPGPAGRPALAR